MYQCGWSLARFLFSLFLGGHWFDNKDNRGLNVPCLSLQRHPGWDGLRYREQAMPPHPHQKRPGPLLHKVLNTSCLVLSSSCELSEELAMSALPSLWNVGLCPHKSQELAGRGNAADSHLQSQETPAHLPFSCVSSDNSFYLLFSTSSLKSLEGPSQL